MEYPLLKAAGLNSKYSFYKEHYIIQEILLIVAISIFYLIALPQKVIDSFGILQLTYYIFMQARTLTIPCSLNVVSHTTY